MTIAMHGHTVVNLQNYRTAVLLANPLGLIYIQQKMETMAVALDNSLM